ncbi:hypothetical protein FACS189449_03710 [Alphaproteobacteria bacterium]|nr:hypothetical protein FACS189449_03710 [Alphaproteobacteria bacterium]
MSKPEVIPFFENLLLINKPPKEWFENFLEFVVKSLIRDSNDDSASREALYGILEFFAQKKRVPYRVFRLFCCAPCYVSAKDDAKLKNLEAEEGRREQLILMMKEDLDILPPFSSFHSK